MTAILGFLLGRSNFEPHGQCFAWDPGILSLLAGSDMLTALAYFSIPVALLYFVGRRDDLEYRWMFGLFAAFITACGTTHLFQVYVLWSPAYGLEGIVKAVTAVISVATAVALWFIMPKALKVPGPGQLRLLNTRLEREIARQDAAQLELIRARDELEERVLERTAELEATNRQLLLAKQRAETADRAKSEFLANVSHELRTPLNSIIGFSELMQTGAMGPIENDRYQEYVGDINEAGRLLLVILNDILDISKIEAGKLELEETEVALGPIANDCIDLVRERAAAAGIELSLAVDPTLPALLADRIRLKQIMLNLLSNAIKFIDGGGEVRITLTAAADGGVQLAVADTGIGIDAQDIERITEPFVQASSAATRRHGGTGLGLALVKQLVEMHDGMLSISSEPGRGTTASVFFPATRTI